MSNAFTYTSSTSTPTLTLVAPNTGWTGGGTIMALTGTNFVSGATVTVGGTAATGVTFISSTLLVATAPSGTSGGKTVVVRNPNGQTASRSNGFTYRSTSGTPTFTSVTPNSGPRSGGTLVTVRGTNFLSGTGFRVRIGGYNLTNQEFVSDTEVRGRTPSNSGTGWRSLSIRNPDGLNVSVSAVFRYTSWGSSSMEMTAASALDASEAAEATASSEEAVLGEDADGDGLPSAWETRFGLAADSADGDNGAAGDPDGDGSPNADEYRNDTHPRGLFRQYVADAAVRDDVETRFAIANPAAAPATVLLSFVDASGAVTRVPMSVGARSRATLDAQSVPALAGTSFSTELESDQAVALDRLTVLGRTGAQVETAVERPSPAWYFADGSTRAPFSLGYVLQNPGDTAAEVQVRYLLADGAEAVTRTYTVDAHGRAAIDVSREDPALAATDVAAEIRSLNEIPIVVERSMTVARGETGAITGGHSSAGATAPSVRWFLQGSTREGTTSLLLANPTSDAAAVEIAYVLRDGERVVRTHEVAPDSRTTVTVGSEDPSLARTAMAIYAVSTNNVPIVVERSTWWGGRGGPEDGSNSLGAAEAGGRWLVAEAEQGGARGASTSVVVSNTGPAPARVAVTLLFEEGPEQSATIEVASLQRATVPIATAFPSAQGRRFSVLVEGLDPATAAGLVVDRSLSWQVRGARVTGADAPGTRLSQ